MIRNPKALGLALVAVFAMSAMMAAAASAQTTDGKFTTGGAARTLIGTQTGTSPDNSLTEFGLTVACPNATYTGHEVGSIVNGVPNNASSMTVTPHYGTCSISGTAFVGQVDMNGCDLVFHLGETTVVAGVEDEYYVKETVVCPANQHVVMTLATSEAEHKAGTNFCKITFTENPLGYEGLKAKDTTNNSFDITGTTSPVVAHKTAVAGHAGILCPTVTKEDGVRHIDLNFKDKLNGAIAISH